MISCISSRYSASYVPLRIWRDDFLEGFEILFGRNVSTWQPNQSSLTLLKPFLHREDKAADSVDLSRGIEKAAREDGTIPATVNVVDIIHSWSEQSGFPILHVSRDKHGVVTLKQERFLSADASAADRNKMWWLPYNFAIPDDTNFENTLPDDWMTSSQQTITLNSGAFGKKWTSNDWMIFNKKQTSYYRVNYDNNLWSLIIRELHNGNFNQIHYTNRAQLLEDAFKLARLNRLNYDIVFGLISSMHKELEYLPWAVFNNNLGDINLYLSGSPNYEQFRVSIHFELGKPFLDSITFHSSP